MFPSGVGPWAKSPEAEAVCTVHTLFTTAETIKILKFRTIHLLILDKYMYVSPWGS